MIFQHSIGLGPATILLLLLALPLPSYTFLRRSDDDDHSGEIEVMRPLAELALGGGTRIVWEMITFGYLRRIKPAIRDLILHATSFTLSTLISSIWSLIAIVAELITWFIEVSVFLFWRVKWDITSFILDQLNPLSRRDITSGILEKSLMALVNDANEALFEAL